MKVYYAHSIALYGTEQEKRDITLLTSLGFEVVNPNAPEHDAGYKLKGMPYFYSIVHGCGSLAFRANPDGSINAGVATEIQWMREKERPVGFVFELPVGIERRGLSVAQTRAYLKEQGFR